MTMKIFTVTFTPVDASGGAVDIPAPGVKYGDLFVRMIQTTPDGAGQEAGAVWGAMAIKDNCITQHSGNYTGALNIIAVVLRPV